MKFCNMLLLGVLVLISACATVPKRKAKPSREETLEIMWEKTFSGATAYYAKSFNQAAVNYPMGLLRPELFVCVKGVSVDTAREKLEEMARKAYALRTVHAMEGKTIEVAFENGEFKTQESQDFKVLLHNCQYDAIITRDRSCLRIHSCEAEKVRLGD